MHIANIHGLAAVNNADEKLIGDFNLRYNSSCQKNLPEILKSCGCETRSTRSNQLLNEMLSQFSLFSSFSLHFQHQLIVQSCVYSHRSVPALFTFDIIKVLSPMRFNYAGFCFAKRLSLSIHIPLSKSAELENRCIKSRNCIH